jgi:hypothetical protein
MLPLQEKSSGCLCFCAGVSVSRGSNPTRSASQSRVFRLSSEIHRSLQTKPRIATLIGSLSLIKCAGESVSARGRRSSPVLFLQATFGGHTSHGADGHTICLALRCYTEVGIRCTQPPSRASRVISPNQAPSMSARRPFSKEIGPGGQPLMCRSTGTTLDTPPSTA